MDDPNKLITEQLKLYSTQEHQCSYLQETPARTLFLDPETPVTAKLIEDLANQGFWRSGHYLFKPQCNTCNACIPIRIPLHDYLFSKNEKRCIKQNQDLEITLHSNVHCNDLYDLYQRYISERHRYGDMFPPSIEQFTNFIANKKAFTKVIRFTLNNQLICASIVDELENSCLAIYTFYDSNFLERSLGHFSILWQINYSQQRQKRYLYLGYWITASDKMRYKQRYLPHEILKDNQWHRIRKKS